MTNEQLTILALELDRDIYDGKSLSEIQNLLNTPNQTPYSRFGSFRTLASLLTQDEYTTLRTTLNNLSSNVLIADMIHFLEMPGDESGNGGGIDFGNESVRTMLDQLFDFSAKIKAYAEKKMSRAEILGLPFVEQNDIHNTI
jgi:hypothetical protein